MSGSGFTTSVPQPSFGPNGVVIPTEDAILTGVQTDINTALGGGVNPQLSTPQGQIATTETAVIGDSNVQFAFFCNQVDPALNSGRMQDAIGRIYFMTRIAAAPTVQPCVCAGLNTTPIGIGALAQDPDTNLFWVCQEAGAIGIGGTVTLNFACTTLGPIAAPESLKIAQAIIGWESITPTGDAVLGNNVESPAAFEQRRQNSVAANSSSLLDSILGTVLAISGVLDCYVTENTTNVTATIGGVVLGPHSLYACVLGGTSDAIAFAIWSKKSPGCGYNGNTIVTVTDPNPHYAPPAPTYMVAFQTPDIIAFAVLVTLANNPGIPANALALIQGSVINAFAGLDGGPRAKIGSTIFAARFYAGVAMLGSWAQIVSIQIGISGEDCSFTGSITGNQLTVSAVSSGALAPGQLIQDAGLLASGTTIIAQVSGPTGGSGVYTISNSQTISSESMTATNMVNDVTMNIDQAPAVSAANIGLALVTL